jgi:hypothetical protein
LALKGLLTRRRNTSKKDAPKEAKKDAPKEIKKDA